MLSDEVVEIWGDGEQIRNWTYVEDNVAGALLAAEHLDRGAINIGIEERLTPNTALNMIWRQLKGYTYYEAKYLLDKPVGPRNRVADSTKLKSIGWSPKYTFEEGLQKTIEWYVSNHSVDELKMNLERRLTER
jgi:nucleoside-diphosphate-sugar epimerase